LPLSLLVLRCHPSPKAEDLRLVFCSCFALAFALPLSLLVLRCHPERSEGPPYLVLVLLLVLFLVLFLLLLLLSLSPIGLAFRRKLFFAFLAQKSHV
jgi:hypothetical protein